MYLLVFSAVTHKYTEAAHIICALMYLARNPDLIGWDMLI